ncbi:MAG: DEAD/DEAH box helicase [Nitrososphaerales archaeon]
MESSLTELERKTYKKLAELGFTTPTPIQAKAIPVVLRRRNCLLVAPTGSGKTEAALIPILTLLSQAHKKVGVRLLYITPLRALNRDIFKRLVKYAEYFGLTAAVRHGDTPTSARAKMAHQPPDVLITTPETLAIILVTKLMRKALSNLEWVVVDELHELLGSERGAHLSVSIERLLKYASSKKVVRIGLSATVGNLAEAAYFISGAGRKCAVLVDKGVRRYLVKCEYVEGGILPLAGRIVEYAKETIAKDENILVFTNTRDEAEYLVSALRAEAPELEPSVHHGSLSRESREEAELRLKSGEAGIVVATSSLELGLDIGSVNLVIQVGSPRQATKLIQRIGRSRHKVGEAARGFILTDRLDDEAEALALLERVKRLSLEESRLHRRALDVLAHHLVGLALEYSRLNVEEALNLIRRAYPYKDVKVDDIEGCLNLLSSNGIVWFDGLIFRSRGLKTLQYYYDNISTIPDVVQFDVIDISANKKVGRLDQLFVGEFGEEENSFTLKGLPWRIVSVDDSKRVVNVEPLPKGTTTIPYWVGELIPVEFETAQIVGRIRRDVAAGRKNDVSENYRKLMSESREKLGVIPSDKLVVVERCRGSSQIVIHCCFGTKVNHTLASLLSTLLSSKLGYLVEAKSDTYRILLSSQANIQLNHIIEALSDISNLEGILSVAVSGTHPMNWKTWQVAKKFGLIDKAAQYDRRAARLIQERYINTPLHQEVLREITHEKFDLEKAKRVMEQLKNGEIRMKYVEVEAFTPLAQPIIEYAAKFAALPHSIDQALTALVKERLMNTKHKLICLHCGRWESIVKTSEAKEPLSCSICHSRLVASTYLTDQEARKIVEKQRSGLKLNAEEEAKLKKLWKTSSLIQNFGRQALLTLSGRGVGPEVASRLLRNFVDEDSLVKSIYRAEKTYLQTRGFWED